MTRCFLELFRSHLNGVLERPEAWNPFYGRLDDFGNDVAVTLNSDAHVHGQLVAILKLVSQMPHNWDPASEDSFLWVQGHS